jgi:hypothetical protein
MAPDVHDKLPECPQTSDLRTMVKFLTCLLSPTIMGLIVEYWHAWGSGQWIMGSSLVSAPVSE